MAFLSIGNASQTEYFSIKTFGHDNCSSYIKEAVMFPMFSLGRWNFSPTIFKGADEKAPVKGQAMPKDASST
jgi:hypothetical protein